MAEENNEFDPNKTFEAAVERSKALEADIAVNPKKYRVLTGDRPTGRLHIGHYFGSLQNRVRISKMGVPTMILIADYQVLTDQMLLTRSARIQSSLSSIILLPALNLVMT